MEMDAQRKLLDSLMGSNRNGVEERSTKKFTDSDVCKNYLCGLCPSELLLNTKTDIGECRKKHSDILKQDYEEASKKRDYGYERDLMKTLKRIIEDCDRRIEKAVKRLEEITEKDSAAVNAAIKELYDQAELLGEEGDIEGARVAIQKAEELKKRRTLDKTQNPQPHSAQQERLRPCDVCGAFLSIYDSNRRLADHFGGKMHIGFMEVRKKYEELVEKYAQKPQQDVEVLHNREYFDRDAPSSNRDRSKRRWSPGYHDRYGDRDRDRGRDRRDRDYWDRDNDRVRDRDWDRDRDYGRDRDWDGHRDRHYDRDERDHDRERDYRNRDHSSRHRESNNNNHFDRKDSPKPKESNEQTEKPLNNDPSVTDDSCGLEEGEI